MFLKQVKYEMDDFKEFNNFGPRGKNFNILRKYFEQCPILTDTLAKMSQNIFAYSFVSEHSKHYF